MSQQEKLSVFPDEFPLECGRHVLSFLVLYDVLQMASSSVKSMNDSLPSLHSRRKEMKQSYVFAPDWSTTGFPSRAVLNAEKAYRDYPEIAWAQIPAVEERVTQLHKQIPKSHPLCLKVKELKCDLETKVDEDDESPRVIFYDCFDRFKCLTKAHRLHADIINSAMNSHPLDEIKSGRISLDRYMGDVLTVTYLLNQSHLRLVEGGPSSESLLKKLRHLPHEISCYQSWVYIHSSILRRKSFSPQQRDRLGIPENNGISEMIPTDLYANNNFMASVLTLVYSDFGPLGPSFRGRDNVHLEDITYRNLFGFWMSTHTSAETLRVVNTLIAIHEQSRKARPMTVQPPIVRLSSTSN